MGAVFSCGSLLTSFCTSFAATSSLALAIASAISSNVIRGCDASSGAVHGVGAIPPIVGGMCFGVEVWDDGASPDRGLPVELGVASSVFRPELISVENVRKKDRASWKMQHNSLYLCIQDK